MTSLIGQSTSRNEQPRHESSEIIAVAPTATLACSSGSRLRPSLFKALWFAAMRTPNKSGQLNFMCCWQFWAFEHFLLPAAQWAKQREAGR